jgi:hypothetical protein
MTTKKQREYLETQTPEYREVWMALDYLVQARKQLFGVEETRKLFEKLRDLEVDFYRKLDELKTEVLRE